MQAQREQWQYKNNCRVWTGKYLNSQNLPHWHYDCELLFVERGSLLVHCNRESYNVNAGQAFFINSEQVHNMRASVKNTITAVIIFDYNIIKNFTDEITLASPLLTQNYEFTNLYDSLKRELGYNDKFCSHTTANLISLFMANVFRAEPIIKKEKNVRMMEQFKNLLTEINEKYEFYDLNAAADFICMNPSYFSRLFHKLTGMTFSQYLNYVKVENAINMLKTNNSMTITQISDKCGFATIRNFNRIFKEFTGYAPKSIPTDYILKEGFTSLNEKSANPTSIECKLLESSDN